MHNYNHHCKISKKNLARTTKILQNQTIQRDNES